MIMPVFRQKAKICVFLDIVSRVVRVQYKIASTSNQQAFSDGIFMSASALQGFE